MQLLKDMSAGEIRRRFINLLPEGWPLSSRANWFSDSSEEEKVKVVTALGEEVLRLREVIRLHHSRTGHEMCFENDEELWSAVPDLPKLDHFPPAWCEFMQKCAQYRASKDADKIGTDLRIARNRLEEKYN